MDSKDRVIIDLLRKDSRMSIRAIAKQTKIRPSTVHVRMKKLKEEGIIKRYTLKLNSGKVDEGFIVFVFVKTKPYVELDKNIIDSKYVKEVFGITGEYDLLIKMKFKDVSEFNDYIIKFRKKEKVENTLTMVVTADIKEEL